MLSRRIRRAAKRRLDTTGRRFVIYSAQISWCQRVMRQVRMATVGVVLAGGAGHAALKQAELARIGTE